MSILQELTQIHPCLRSRVHRVHDPIRHRGNDDVRIKGRGSDDGDDDEAEGGDVGVDVGAGVGVGVGVVAGRRRWLRASSLRGSDHTGGVILERGPILVRSNLLDLFVAFCNKKSLAGTLLRAN